MPDKEFLEWIYLRLKRHGENPNVDYMHKLKNIIKNYDPVKVTPNILEGNSDKKTSKRRTVTYCQSCIDDYSDENYMLGLCCGLPMKTREETDEEYNSRCKAEEAIRRRVKSYKDYN